MGHEQDVCNVPFDGKLPLLHNLFRWALYHDSDGKFFRMRIPGNLLKSVESVFRHIQTLGDHFLEALSSESFYRIPEKEGHVPVARTGKSSIGYAYEFDVALHPFNVFFPHDNNSAWHG